MFMFVNMLVIDRYTSIGNVSSTKSLPSIYWVFVNFLWASPNVWKIHKHLKLAKVHLENIQGVKLLEMQRTIPLRSHQKCVEVYSKNDLYCEQKWLDMWFIRCVSLGSFFISILPIRSSLLMLEILKSLITAYVLILKSNTTQHPVCYRFIVMDPYQISSSWNM